MGKQVKQTLLYARQTSLNFSHTFSCKKCICLSYIAPLGLCASVLVCVCVRARACARAPVCATHACVRTCVRVCVCGRGGLCTCVCVLGSCLGLFFMSAAHHIKVQFMHFLCLMQFLKRELDFAGARGPVPGRGGSGGSGKPEKCQGCSNIAQCKLMRAGHNRARFLLGLGLGEDPRYDASLFAQV